MQKPERDTNISLVDMRISDFQSYVRDQHARRSRSWTHAQGMVQEIAEILSVQSSAKPPVNLQVAAQRLRTTIRQGRTHSKRLHGSLVPVSGGFDAIIFSQELERSNDQRELQDESKTEDLSLNLSRRGRFTLAHELGHALFYTFGEGNIPQRIIPAPPKYGAGAWREEGLCHAFARALLVPTEWRAAVGKEASFRNLIEASSLFQISGEGLIYRILYDWQKWRTTVFLYVQLLPTGPSARIFRGADRGGDVAFTKPQVEDVLRGSKNPVEASQRLCARFPLSRRNILLRRMSLWAIA